MQHSESSQFPSPQAPARKPKNIKKFNEEGYRSLVWLLVGIAALLTLGGLGAVGDPTEAADGMLIAETNKSINDTNASGAPQQQVVNGWYMADVLPVISAQLSGIHEAGMYTARLYALGLIALLGVCFDIAGRGFGRQFNKRVDARETSADGAR